MKIKRAKKIFKDILINDKHTESFLFYWPIIFFIFNFSKIPILAVSLVLNVSIAFSMLHRKQSQGLFWSTIFIVLMIFIQIILLLNYTNLTILILNNNLKFLLKWLVFSQLLFFFTNEMNTEKLINFVNLKRIKRIFNFSLFILFIQLIMYFFGYGVIKIYGETHFKSFLYNAHVNAYYMLTIQTVFMIRFLLFEDNINFKNKFMKTFSPLLIQMSSVFIVVVTGARTPALISVIFLLIYIVTKFNLFTSKKNTSIFLISIFSISSLIIILSIMNILNITIIDKSLSLITNPSKFFNSRDLIANSMFKFIKERFNYLNYLFGYSFGKSIIVNQAQIRHGIWAHNDFLEIYFSAGIFGLTIYSYVLFNYLKCKKSLIFTFIVLFLSFFNGLFIYQEFSLYLPVVSIFFMNFLNLNTKNRKEVLL